MAGNWYSLEMTRSLPQISPKLAQATDTLLQVSIDALEAAGADMDADCHASQHSLVMPGNHLVEVQAAMEEWIMVSCEQGACDSWNEPQAKAAQVLYQVLEGIFGQGAQYRNLRDQASFPMLISGQSLDALQEVRQDWASACKPVRRMELK